MWTWTKITIAVFAACGVICRVAGHILWMKMKEQNKQEEALHPPPPPRRGFRSFRIGDTVTIDHRKNYPKSKLRNKFIAVQFLFMASFLAAGLTWFIYPDLP